MKKIQSIKSTNTFARIYREGKPLRCKYFILLYLYDQSLASSMVGFSVSKKVGKAVTRNKLKRRLINIIDSKETIIKEKYMFVFVARRAAAESSFETIKENALTLMKRANLLCYYETINKGNN